MNRIFARENEKLKESILRLAGEVEGRLHDVLKAIERRDKEALLTLIELDSDIDEREVLIEEECLKILALHQPVARDLRFVIAVLKINSDLERIGDIVVNIAGRGVRLSEFPVPDLQETIMCMGRLTRAMLKDSLDSLIVLDVGKAAEVIARDDEVDRLNVEVIRAVVSRAAAADSGASIEPLILIQSMARDLERIGDHATNIAEDVAYLVDGTIIRHKHAGKN
jgi:phosphate transport system protein